MKRYVQPQLYPHSKQRQLAFARTETRKTIKRYTDRERHDRNNLEAALIIVSEADRYGGEDAGVVRWARLVIARLGSDHGMAVAA